MAAAEELYVGVLCVTQECGRAVGSEDLVVASPYCEDGYARIAQPPVDWDAPDSEPVDLVFLIAVPADTGKQHLKILAQLTRALMKDVFRAALRGADSPDRVVELVGERLGLITA